MRRCALFVMVSLLVSGPAWSQAFDPFEESPAPNSIVAGEREREREVQQFDVLIPYEEEMRGMIQRMSAWAKQLRPDFQVVALEGLELIRHLEETSLNTRENARTALDYIKSLDGLMVEGLMYGRDGFDVATHPEDEEYYRLFVNEARELGLTVMSVDHGLGTPRLQEIYGKATDYADLIFAAGDPRMQLSAIPDFPPRPLNENHRPIFTLKEARNYAMVLNSAPFGSKSNFVTAMKNTNYDLLVLDAFHAGRQSLTFEDMRELRYKRLGTRRLLFAYMSIGTAESFRYYWNSEWTENQFAAQFVAEPVTDPRFGTEYHVRYWDRGWQDILYGNENAYLTGILQLGFDGVVLGNIDAYHRWKNL